MEPNNGSLLQLVLQKERTEEETSLSDRTCRKTFAARPQSITGEGGGGVWRSSTLIV